MGNSFKLSKIFLQHLAMSKWYLIAFALFILLSSIIVCLFLLINLEYINNPLVIANYSINGYFSTYSISKLCNLFLLSAPMFIIISLLIIFIINKYLVFELNNRTIFYWLTSNKSRLNIITWKIIFINFFLTILLLPLFFVISIIGLEAYDKKEFIGKLFTYFFTFTVAIYAFVNLYIMIGVLLYKKIFLFNASVITFLFIILALFLFQIIYKPRESNDSVLIIASYFSLESFYLDKLHFSLQNSDKNIYIGDNELKQFRLEKNNIVLYFFLLGWEVLILPSTIIITEKKFINYEFYI